MDPRDTILVADYAHEFDVARGAKRLALDRARIVYPVALVSDAERRRRYWLREAAMALTIRSVDE